MLGARTPTTPDAGDNGSISVGRQVPQRRRRHVNGIRFYKATANTGTHVGALWTARRPAARRSDLQKRNGLRLAAGRIRSPVAIQANTTYVASYFAPTGTTPTPPGR